MTSPTSPDRDDRRSLRRHLLGGFVTIGVLVFGLGGWAATTEISGAVIGSGLVVVESDVKKVQHQTGGTVGELRVREGQRVSAGDVVLRLDDTVLRANLAIVVKGLDEMAGRKARLESEIDGLADIRFPKTLLDRADDPEVARVLQSERRLFELRRTVRTGQKSQLGERITQLEEEIRGHTAQETAKAEEIVLIGRELDGVRDLWQKNLVPITRLTALERETTRIRGERAQLIAQVAQARGRISELRMQIAQIDQDLGNEVARELRDTESRIGEFVERRTAAEDQLGRVDLRAPVTGKVHQLAVHTVGGVIGPGEAVMLIVPESEPLSIEVRVVPSDIDQIVPGQPVGIRFSAFDQRTTPEITGKVQRVAADVTHDGRTGQSYFSVRVAIPPEELARLNTDRVVPGLPVEAFFKTADRTVLSYFVKPLQDQLARAFRER